MNRQHEHQSSGWLQRAPLLIGILLGGALLCGAGRAQACSNDNNVEWNYLFADQGPIRDAASDVGDRRQDRLSYQQEGS